MISMAPAMRSYPPGIVPGLALAITMSPLTFTGDGLRDALIPRMRAPPERTTMIESSESRERKVQMARSIRSWFCCSPCAGGPVYRLFAAGLCSLPGLVNNGLPRCRGQPNGADARGETPPGWHGGVRRQRPAPGSGTLRLYGDLPPTLDPGVAQDATSAGISSTCSVAWSLDADWKSPGPGRAVDVSEEDGGTRSICALKLLCQRQADYRQDVVASMERRAARPSVRPWR